MKILPFGPPISATAADSALTFHFPQLFPDFPNPIVDVGNGVFKLSGPFPAPGPASVAQLVELWFCKPVVKGSSPFASSKGSTGSKQFFDA